MSEWSFDVGALIAVILVAALGLPLLRRLLTFEGLLGERVGPLALEPDEDRPDYERAYLEAGFAPYASLGFGPPRLFRMHEVGPDTWRGALVARRGPVLLILLRAPSPRLTGGHIVQLVSFADDGRGVATLPGLAPLMPGRLPSVHAVEPPSHDPPDVLRAHLDALTGAGWLEDDAALLSRWQAAEARMQDELRREGLTEPDPDRPGIDRLTLRGAWRWTGRLMRARPVEGPEPALPPEVAADVFEDVARNKAAPRRRDFSLGLLALTAALFAAGIAALWSPAAALVLTGAVFLHELGHLAAMRALGAKNTSVFFIPFLGAATTGQREVGTLAQEVGVLLAGPVPGLALAAALIGLNPAWLDSDTGQLALVVLIGLNLFNLLPFFPLDGGKVVHAVLFARRPFADGVSRLVATLVLLLAGLGLGDPILIFVGAVGLLGVKSAFAMARMEADLRAQGVGADTPPHARRAAIFAAQQDGRPSRLSTQMVRARLLDHRLSTPIRGAGARWGGGLAYGASVLLGAAALASFVWTARSGAGVESPHEVVAVRTLPCDGSVVAPPVLSGLHALDVRCETSNPKDVLHTLTPYSMASLLLCAPEPWDASAEQRRAVASIGRAQDAHYALLSEGGAPSVQRILQSLGAEVDVDVARAYLELTLDLDPDEHEPYLRRLRRLAGFPESCPRPGDGAPPGLAVFDANDAVDLSIWRAPDAAELTRIRDYLCQTGCRALEARWWPAPQFAPESP